MDLKSVPAGRRRVRKVTMTATLDGENCMIRLPQDPGGAGKFQAHYLAAKLRGFSVTSEREEVRRPMRARLRQPPRGAVE
jgi:phage terminase large subunit-like protein